MEEHNTGEGRMKRETTQTDPFYKSEMLNIEDIALSGIRTEVHRHPLINPTFIKN